MKKKTAIITGITGQDGAYLAEYLLQKGYNVVGLTRSYTSAGLSKLTKLGIENMVEVQECDLMDYSSIIRILQKINPDELYNLAAQSSVAASFNQPIEPGWMRFQHGQDDADGQEPIAAGDPTADQHPAPITGPASS